MITKLNLCQTYNSLMTAYATCLCCKHFEENCFLIHSIINLIGISLPWKENLTILMFYFNEKVWIWTSEFIIMCGITHSINVSSNSATFHQLHECHSNNCASLRPGDAYTGTWVIGHCHRDSDNSLSLDWPQNITWMNQCWFIIVNWTLRGNVQWNFIKMWWFSFSVQG